MKSFFRMFETSFRLNVTSCKSVLAVSLLFTFCLAFCAENTQEKWRTLLNDNFRPLSIKNVSESNKADLRALNIDPDRVSQQGFPSKWRCDVKAFPQAWTIVDKEKDGLAVSADPSITFHTSSIEIAYDPIRFEVEATGPGKLEAGITFPDAPGLTFLQEVPRSADGVFHFSYDVPQDTANLVSVRIRVSGDVNLLSAKLLAKVSDDSSIGEGTISEMSFIPQLANIAEDNCYFIADIKVKQTLEGKTLPQEIRVLMPGVLRRALATGAYFHRNSKCRFTVKPYENCILSQRQYRQIDSLPEELTPLYFVSEILNLSSFSTVKSNSRVPGATSVVPADFVSRYQETEEDISQKTSVQAAQFVNAQIAAFLDANDKLEADALKKFAEKFKGAWTEKYADLEKLEDERGWFYDGDTGWALSKDYDITARQEIVKPVLNTLTSFRDYLHAHGCRLLVQIVPSAESVAARRILPEFDKEPDTASLQVFRQLLEAGIESMPAYSALFSADTADTPAFFLYSVNNALNDAAQDVLAAQVAKYLSAQFAKGTFPEVFKKSDYVQKRRVLNYRTMTHKWPKNVKFKENLADTLISVSEIYVKDAPFKPDRNSSVLIIGNGLVHEPMALCNYGARLARQINMNPDVLAVYGKLGWVNAMRRVYADPERYLNGKKVVILPIYADDLCIRHNTPDFRQFDESCLAFRGRNYLADLKITDSHAHVDSMKLPSEDRALWRNFFFTTAYITTFAENKLSKKLHAVAIPELYRNKQGLICRINAALHFSTPEAVITVNGEEYKIYASSQEDPQWQSIDVPLKSGSGSIDISVTAASKDAIIAIRDIKLYGIK